MMMNSFIQPFGAWMMVLWWTLIIATSALLIRWILLLGRNGSPSHTQKDANARGEDALEILKERYARGEIDKEEFETKKHDLQI